MARGGIEIMRICELDMVIELQNTEISFTNSHIWDLAKKLLSSRSDYRRVLQTL